MSVWIREFRKEDLEVSATVPQGIWKRYVDGSGDSRGMLFGLGCLRPGETVSHSHEEEEAFYVLSGHGEAIWREKDEEVTQELRPGVAFYKSSGVYHVMRNTGTEDLVGIFCKV